MADKVKVRVLRRFRNKYSKSLHQAGDLLVISPKRMEEINAAGYGHLVELVEEDQRVEIEPAGSGSGESVEPVQDEDEKADEDEEAR